MKITVSLLTLLTILTVTTSCSYNTGNINNANIDGSSSDVNINQVKEKIVDLENKVNSLFSTDVENVVISYLDGNENVPIYKYVGVNNKFSDVCYQLKDYCTPTVAEMLIRKIGFINIDGNIGVITATGEGTYSEFDETSMNLISLEDNTAVVRITKFMVGGDYSQDYLYTFQIGENGNFIMTDLKEVERDKA